MLADIYILKDIYFQDGYASCLNPVQGFKLFNVSHFEN